jgi:HPt (histidine-containing phosphotransfer) domain-containing protein
VTGERILVKVDPDLEELIPGFLENRGKDLTKLHAAMDRNDLPAIQSIGHSLKGVGGGYGFMRLSEIGAEMEVAAKAGNAAALPELINALADYLSRVVVEYG